MAIVCIERRKLHQKVYFATCRNCGSVFEALKEDLKFKSSRNEDYIEAMPCIQCKVLDRDENTLHFKEVPRSLRK